MGNQSGFIPSGTGTSTNIRTDTGDYLNPARNYLQSQWQANIKNPMRTGTFYMGGLGGTPEQTAGYMKLFNYILSRPNIESGVMRAYDKANQEAMQKNNPAIQNELVGNMAKLQAMQSQVEQQRANEIANGSATYETQADYWNTSKMLDDFIKKHKDFLGG